MKGFLMLVGVAVVAGAMYVAAASGSHKAKFASQKEVAALQKKVTKLTTELKTVKPEADVSASYLLSCLLSVSGSSVSVNVMPVSQFGSSSNGFLFGAPGTPPTSATARTALDVNSSSPTAFLQEVASSCLSGSALKHRLAHLGARLGH